MGAYRQGERPPRRRRPLVRLAAAALAVAAAVLLLLPPAPIALPAGARDPRLVAGALHVHSTRSDGLGTPAAIAAAAASAGLQFVVLTDHGDGTRAPDPPAYRSGVLVLDGVEISTAGGHYVAIGMSPSAYPLAGEPADVAEDVARLGGLGIVAHPASAKPELTWRDWDARFDGAEWLSGDAEWRDEGWGTLARAAATYVFRPGPSLARVFDRPAALLTRLDARAKRRPVLLAAGIDAHGGIGREGQRRLPVPSYASAFGAVSVRVTLRGALRGDAPRDAAVLVDALRARRVYTAIDALARPARFTFTAQSGGARAEMGGRVPAGERVTFRVRANGPPGSTLTLLRDGGPVASGPPPSLDYAADGSAAIYRVEVSTPRAPGDPPVPWILSNAISVGPAPAAEDPSAGLARSPRVVLFEPGDRSHWMAERDPTSHAEVAAPRRDGPLELSYSLGLNPQASPFAAILRELPAGLAVCEELVLTLSASRDMRVAVQLREPGGERPSEGRRWRRSVFVPAGGRTIALRITDLKPAPRAGRAHPDPGAVRGLLLVVDTVNARPGERGVVRVHRAGCF